MLRPYIMFVNMSTFYDIYDFSLFANAKRNDIDRFLQNTPSKIKLYEKGDIVALQNSPCKSLMLLCEGSLSARMSNSEGKEIIIETLRAPEVLAPAFLYGSENKFPVTLQAEENVRIWLLSRDAFLKMMETNPTILNNFIQSISDRSIFLSRKLNEFALQNLNNRIISYLQNKGEITNIQEVAFIMGVARPSLSRSIQAMVEQKLLRKTENGYELEQNI